MLREFHSIAAFSKKKALLAVYTLRLPSLLMGHKERRQREIESMKAEILQAARKLARGNGWQSVSIRKICSVIEYTPPVIYEHYKRKEEILQALEEMGFRKLEEKLQAIRAAQPDPAQQLLRMTAAYREFALREFDLYQVMFNLEGIYCEPPAADAIMVCAQPVLETLQELRIFALPPEPALLQWWALVHGYVSLEMSKQAPANAPIGSYLQQAVTQWLEQVKVKG